MACLGAEQVLEVAQVTQLPVHDQPVWHAASLRALPAVGAAPAPRLAAEALPAARAAAHIRSSSRIVDMKEHCISKLKHDKSMQACERVKCSICKCAINQIHDLTHIMCFTHDSESVARCRCYHRWKIRHMCTLNAFMTCFPALLQNQLHSAGSHHLMSRWTTKSFSKHHTFC